jgi:hypothetical protein
MKYLLISAVQDKHEIHTLNNYFRVKIEECKKITDSHPQTKTDTHPLATRSTGQLRSEMVVTNASL